MPALKSIAEWVGTGNRLTFDMPLGHSPFSSIWSSGFFDLDNLAAFNRAAYSDISSRDAVSLDILEEYNFIRATAAADDEEYEQRELYLSKLRSKIKNNDIVIDGIKAYADQVTVISSWTFVEKMLNRMLSELRPILGLSSVTDHRWHAIAEAYAQCGITLSGCDHFADIDECRKLNNAIKHGGVVSPALAAYSSFDGKVGLEINECQLDTQRYYFGAAGYTAAIAIKSAERLNESEHSI